MRVGLALALLLAAPLLAGCLGGDSAPERAATLPAETDRPDDVGNVTNGTRLDVDAPPNPWADGELERILFEGTVSTTRPCYAPVAFPAEARILHGTGSLRVAADAGAATRTGSYHVDFLSAGGRYNGGVDEEDTANAAHEWIIPLAPIDWDAPDAESSTALLSIECSHGAGAHVLQGAVRVTVAVVRDPAWAPRAPLAPRLLLDENTTWYESRGADWLAMGGDGSPPMPFDAIPHDALFLTLAVRWGQPNECPAGHECAPNPRIFGNGQSSGGSERERTDVFLLQVYGVGTDVPADEEGAETSAMQVSPFVWRCNWSDPTFPCFAPYYLHAVSLDVRVVLHAWWDPVDPAWVDAYLGDA